MINLISENTMDKIMPILNKIFVTIESEDNNSILDKEIPNIISLRVPHKKIGKTKETFIYIHIYIYVYMYIYIYIDAYIYIYTYIYICAP
jgi:hypothetical protein